MNKDLALKISKHPLIKRLLESTDQKTVARLIVEELMDEQEEAKNFEYFKSKIENANSIEDLQIIEDEFGKLPGKTQFDVSALNNLFKKKKEEIQPQEIDIKKLLAKFYDFLNGMLQESIGKFVKALKLDGKSFGKTLGKTFDKKEIETLAQYFSDKNKTIEFVNQYFESEKKSEIINNIKTIFDGEDTKKTTDATTDTEQPTSSTLPSDTEQPDKFDLDNEQDKELKAAAKNFINEFYEQDYLFQQGQIVKELLSVLLSIKSGEEKEKAAKTSRKRKKIQEQEEDKLEASKGRLRSIQISFRTFLRDIKVAKKALKNFQEVADKGSIVASSTKKEFIKLLQRQQRDIVTLFNALTDAYTKRLDEAEASKGETELKWERIEKYYDIASEKLRSLLNLSNDNELRNSILLIDETIDALRELTKEFPNVNPFGRKDDNYDQFGDEYDNAIENVKSVSLQPILELTRTGSGSQSAVERALEGLKEFSQQIATIFGVKSQFKDAPPPPEKEDPAAEAGEEKPKTAEPEATVYEEFDIEDLYAVLEKHKDTYEKAKRLIETGSLNEDKRLANLKKVEDEFDTQADVLSNMFGVLGDLDSQSKKSVVKAAQTFVDMYDELTQAYNALKDKELGTQTSAKLTMVFDSIRDELDQMKSALEPIMKDAPKGKQTMLSIKRKVHEILPIKTYQVLSGGTTEYYSTFIKFILYIKSLLPKSVNEQELEDKIISDSELDKQLIGTALKTIKEKSPEFFEDIKNMFMKEIAYQRGKEIFQAFREGGGFDALPEYEGDFFKNIFQRYNFGGIKSAGKPKTGVVISDVARIFADELEVEPEEAEEIATQIQKATVDLGQQSQDLSQAEIVDEIVDDLMKSDAFEDIVSKSNQEEKKVEDIVTKVVEQTVEEPMKTDKKEQEVYSYFLLGSEAESENGLSINDIHNKIDADPNGKHMIYDENARVSSESGWVIWKEHPDFKDYSPNRPDFQNRFYYASDSYTKAILKSVDEIKIEMEKHKKGKHFIHDGEEWVKLPSEKYPQFSDSEEEPKSQTDAEPKTTSDSKDQKSTFTQEDFNTAIEQIEKQIKNKGGVYDMSTLNEFKEVSDGLADADQAGKLKEIMLEYLNGLKEEDLRDVYSQFFREDDEFTIDNLATALDDEQMDQQTMKDLYAIATAAKNIKEKLPKENEELEEQIANKLKPLIKEMLRRNK